MALADVVNLPLHLWQGIAANTVPKCIHVHFLPIPLGWAYTLPLIPSPVSVPTGLNIFVEVPFGGVGYTVQVANTKPATAHRSRSRWVVLFRVCQGSFYASFFCCKHRSEILRRR